LKERLKTIARYVGYPLLYLASLAFFFYLTFPMGALRGRILAEFERQQRYGRPGNEPVMTLEIGDLDTYWLSGIELEHVKLTVPPRAEKPKAGMGGLNLGSKDAEPPAPSVIAIERFHARVRILPLLLGRVMVDFHLDAFGGTIHGSAPYASPGKVEVEIENVHLEQVEPLKAMVQNQPLFGVLHGTIMLQPEEGKFAKASGKVDLQIDDVSMFDGKSKLMGLALPTAQIGRVALAAKADKGQLEIEELSVQGKDLELSGEGKIRLNESYKRSTADLFLKFKFTDAYRDKDDATRSLLGKPGSKIKAAIEELDPQRTFVRAKTEDDFYRFHLVGRLDKLDVQPAGIASGGRGKQNGRPGFTDGNAGGRRGGGKGSEAVDGLAPSSPSTGDGDSGATKAMPPRGATQAIPPGLLNGAPKAEEAVE